MASLSAVRPVPSEELQALEPGSALLSRAGAAVPGQHPHSPGQHPHPPGQHPQPPGQHSNPPGQSKKQPEVDFSDPSCLYDFVLYYHRCSRPAMAAAGAVQSENALAQKIWLQDLADVPPDGLRANAWCNGAPILVNRRTGDAFRGLRACEHAFRTVPALQGTPCGYSAPGGSGGSRANPSFGIVRNGAAGIAGTVPGF